MTRCARLRAAVIQIPTAHAMASTLCTVKSVTRSGLVGVAIAISSLTICDV